MIQTEIIPDEYRELSDDEVASRIRAAKDKLGDDLRILVHYYQRDEVVRWADFQGDSFKLAEFGAESSARHIVFCGVKFMAEASAILANREQRIYLPALDAGCPLADMADLFQVESAWNALEEAGVASDFVPVVYMNSSAAIKAFCGKLGGTVCTSSSAGAAFDWAKAEGKRVFFLPDENLGRNTALAQGFEAREIMEWYPNSASANEQAAEVRGASVLIWKGFCHVHTFFTSEHVAQARKDYGGCLVAVHPECFPSVVERSDANGSTSFLKKYAEDAPAGSTVVIGTEINFVSRLAKENPDKRIVPLARSMCPNMFRTSAADLLWVLEKIGEVNEIFVDEETIGDAKVALDRMLKL